MNTKKRKASTRKKPAKKKAPLRLNIGSKETNFKGFTNVDRLYGLEAFPLDFPDDSAEEIRASHILEHFPYEKWPEVLADWVRVLKPGGLIKIAVPDFGELARAYVAGQHLPYQSFVMGGHIDENDHHGGIMDTDGLYDLMYKAGLCRLQHWESEIQDAASHPWSLNIMGFKPSHPVERLDNVGAVLACPRIGFTMHFRAITEIAHSGADVRMVQGCFWWEQLSEGMETHLANGKDYILTLDYDSVFTKEDVLELYRIMEARPDIDALCAMQSKRGVESMLFNVEGLNDDGKNIFLGYNVAEVSQGHFGLTMFRASSLQSQKRPWMTPIPNEQGRWDDGNVHVDINFWHRWREAGKNLHMACNVPIGHIEEMIAWPGHQLKPIHQYAADYTKVGMPPEVWKNE